MKGKALLFAAFLAITFLFARAPLHAEPSAVGLWEQVDDETGKPQSWFLVSESGGVYTGKIVKVFPGPNDDPNKLWVCSKCEGADRNLPVVGGLNLIKNMTRKGLAYEGGSITDPRDGSVYRALMELSPDGRKLTVRGYLGISLFGRNQIWNRLPDDAMKASAAPRTAQPNSKGAPVAKKK